MKHRRNVLKDAKGYRFGRRTKEAQAKEAIAHAGAHAFAHRRDKKNDRRRSWQIKINASAREQGLSFSKLIGLLKNKNIILDRKVLAEMAETKPETFARLLAQVKY